MSAKKDAPAWDPIEQLEIPLRRPWYVIVPFILVLTASIVAIYVLPEKYKSSILILVESEKVPERIVQRIGTESSRERLTTLKQEILSRTRLERVIRDVDAYPGEVGRAPMSRLIDRMRDDVTVNLRGTDAFTIDFIHSDPEKAMQVTNRLATLFIEETAKSRAAQVEGAYDFIEVQLADSRKELEKKDEALRLYKERNLGALPEQMTANLATLQRLQLDLQQLSENLRVAEDKLSLLQKGVPGAGNPDTEAKQLRAQIASLRERYTDEHPDVKALLRRLSRLEGAQPPADADLSPASRAEIEQARLEVANLRGKQRETEGKMAQLQARVENAPRTEQELITLTRDYEKLKDNYLAMLNKKLEAQMAERLEKRWKGEQFKILDPAHLPESPFYPDPLKFIFLGVVAGLAAGFACAFGAETLDHSIKSVRDLEQALSVPVLASLPHVDDKTLGDGHQGDAPARVGTVARPADQQPRH